MRRFTLTHCYTLYYTAPKVCRHISHTVYIITLYNKISNQMSFIFLKIAQKIYFVK